MTAVTVMVEPVFATETEGVLVTRRSAEPVVLTVVMAVAELLLRLRSLVPLVMLSTLTICVPWGAEALTRTLTLNVEFVPAVKLGLVQVRTPLLPTAMVLQAQPAGGVKTEARTVFAGRLSLKTALTASKVPLLVATCV